MVYHSASWRVYVKDRFIGTRTASAVQSTVKPGTWRVVFFLPEGFKPYHASAVIDDFGSLVEVAQ